jgi:hypothetical protein
MGTVAALALTPDPYEEFSAMAHDALQDWIEKNFAPLFERGERPTLRDLSNLMTQSRSEFLGACLQGLGEKLHEADLTQEWADCDQCGKPTGRKRLDDKKISTLQGRGTLARPYFYCNSCGHGFHPADDALGLARQVHQFDIQERAVVLASEVPFETSARLFHHLTGVSIGNHFAHETLLAVGGVATLDLVIPSQKQIEQRIAEVSELHPEELPILVVSADGAHQPLRPQGRRQQPRGEGEYHEAKGFRIFLLGTGDRIIQLASWHQIQDAPAFREALGFVAQRIPQDKVRIALVADGAPYLWSAMTACFPSGRPILDYYHCSEHIHLVARTQYGTSFLAQQWAEALKARLWLGNVKGTITHLRGVKPQNAKAAEEIRKLINYLDNNKDKIDYARNKAEGFPNGSGAMESANKFLCHTRIKRSGAWWLEENCNEMLAVRCAIYNGTFPRVFDHYMATQPKRT